MMGDYGGELLDFFEEVGAALTEALLSVELTPDEREDYGAKLDVWLGELGDYGVGDTFGAAYRAVEQGWSYPPLVRVLEGEIPDDEYFEELFDHPLTIARLNVLERQGRHEEYLRLSAAAAEDTSHAIMLARLERAEGAVEYASKHLRTPEEALVVAEVLREHGDAEAALLVGERGLSLEGRKARLAGWVRDLAEGLGRHGLALEAALAAFHVDPSLASYLRVRACRRSLAGASRADVGSSAPQHFLLANGPDRRLPAREPSGRRDRRGRRVSGRNLGRPSSGCCHRVAPRVGYRDL